MSKRLKFFLSHLSISLLIAILVMSLIFIFWYPNPLSKAVGVTHLFLMMLGVDIIIGPILGLLVYKEGKKSLKFDLTVIIIIQLSALIFGVYSIAQGRPAWLVYTVDRFELIRNNEIIDKNLKGAKPEFQHPSFFIPKFAAIQFSQDIEQHYNDIFTEVVGGVSLAQFPERYVKLDQVKFQKSAKSTAALLEFNDKKDVNKILKKYPQADAWLPLKANAVDMVVLINKEKAEVVKIVDLRPWK